MFGPCFVEHYIVTFLVFSNHQLVALLDSAYADLESLIRGGPNLLMFFSIFDKGIEDPNTAINGPSLTDQGGVGVA